MLDAVIDDPTFKTIYRSCSTDLCNDGDGVKSTSQQNFSHDGYKGENLLVPGLPFSSSRALRSSSFVIFLNFSTTFFFINNQSSKLFG